jgi:hypothetical protein
VRDIPRPQQENVMESRWASRWRKLWLGAIASIALMACGARESVAGAATNAPRHFAVNGNFDPGGRFVPRDYGFNLADVSSAEVLDSLPRDVMGLMWIGACDGADARFRGLVESVIDHPKLFGFYLMDDPDPSGRWRRPCKAEGLRAESDWIHARRAGIVTFIALMNIGTSAAPDFDLSLGPDNSHVDLFGIAPYPCRRDWPECDFAMIGRFVEAGRRIGISDAAVVPIYQTFGGGEWRSEGGGYRLPDPAELRRILDLWRERIAHPVFDYAYSWGTQKSDKALATSAPLLDVLKRHNGE